MKHKLALLWALILAMLPSRLTIAILRARGARIGKGCYIGMSVLTARNLVLGDHVRIGHFNLLHGLTGLVMESGSKIESMNWITGARKGGLHMGRNASIRRMHFLEASGSVKIGANSIIAGRDTMIYTHSADPRLITVTRSVEIGEWCYIGAACRFIPGAAVGRGTFVGMGTVVSRPFTAEYVVLAGSPAVVRKQLDPLAPYFDRTFKRHGHHPSGYEG